MSEVETRAYLAEVFRDDLAGHPLLSNNSKWINFINVKNEHWSHRNIVLLGDALHTAHFSIGSGTKLALEDAIALARAFEEHTEVADALPAFERTRRPIVDALQSAATESLRWFENWSQDAELDPVVFAYR